jgi:predicted phage-related endonuclease
LGLPLVAEYPTLFRTINSNAAQRRLQDQLDRLLRDQKKETR